MRTRGKQKGQSRWNTEKLAASAPKILERSCLWIGPVPGSVCACPRSKTSSMRWSVLPNRRISAYIPRTAPMPCALLSKWPKSRRAIENAGREDVDAASNTLQAALGGLTAANSGSSPQKDKAGNGNVNAGAATPVGDGTASPKTGGAQRSRRALLAQEEALIFQIIVFSSFLLFLLL